MIYSRAFLYWLLMVPVMVANGAFRVAVLVPAFGERAGQALSVLTGIALLLLIARPFIRSLERPARKLLLRIGALWAALTVAFEFLLGRLVLGVSWRELLAAYDVTRGRLWPLVLAALLAAPFLFGGIGKQESGIGREQHTTPASRIPAPES